MSHSPTSYIDGVPVKISEKYKPPPKISLPQKIVQCLAQCENLRVNDFYSEPFDFQLERNTQINLSSWKNQRQQERFARKERFRQRQTERQRQQDEHQKRMLTAVSYPSAEDLSSDDDEKIEIVEKKTSVVESSSNSVATSAKISPVQDTKPRFDTILIPTIMPGPPKPNSSWSFALHSDESAKETLRSDTNSIYSTSAPQQAICNINWSDFETDTSNPFDNVELKSINDLDILAQVLKQNYISNDSAANEDSKSEKTQSTETLSKSNAIPVNANILNSNDTQSSVANHSTGSYQHPAANNLYASNYSYQNQHQPISPQPPPTTIQHHQVYFNYQNHTMPNSPSSVMDNTYSSNNFNQKYASTYGAYVPLNTSLVVGQTEQSIGSGLPHATGSIKANSVPDILRQLKNPTTGQPLK